MQKDLLAEQSNVQWIKVVESRYENWIRLKFKIIIKAKDTFFWEKSINDVIGHFLDPSSFLQANVTSLMENPNLNFHHNFRSVFTSLGNETNLLKKRTFSTKNSKYTSCQYILLLIKQNILRPTKILLKPISRWKFLLLKCESLFVVIKGLF